MSAQTLESVLTTLDRVPEARSAHDLGAELGVSRVTARHYLEYLTAEGVVLRSPR